MIKRLLPICIILGLLSCQPPAFFNEPQPAGVDNLARFPKRIQGKYLSLEDSSILMVNDRIILQVYDWNKKIHQNQIDSGLILLGDTIMNLGTHEKTLVNHEGDSLCIHLHYVDTVFQINSNNVVRKFKGYYFLNTLYGEKNWEVRKVDVVKGQLEISSISAKEDLESLKEITETVTDTIPPYQFTVTKKQFKEFVKEDGFRNTEKYIKLRQ